LTYKLLPLEEYPTTLENLHFWIKHFFIFKVTSLKIDESKADDFDIASISSRLLQSNNIDTTCNIAREASKAINSLSPFILPLEEFYGYIEHSKPSSIKEIEQHTIKDFVLVKNCNWSDSKKDNYYGKLKTFFNFIQEHNTIHDTDKPFMFNVGLDVHGKTEKIIHARKKQEVPKFLELEDMQKVDKSVLQYKHYKDKDERSKHVLIMRLLTFGMITLSELKKVKDTDFSTTDDIEVLELEVSGRIIPLPRGKFIQYLNLYKSSKECNKSAYLFCGTTKGGEINTKTVLAIIQLHFEDANIKAKPTAETLRNSGAIYLNRYRGVGKLRLQKLLGHKVLASTQRILKTGSIGQLYIANMWNEFKD